MSDSLAFATSSAVGDVHLAVATIVAIVLVFVPECPFAVAEISLPVELWAEFVIAFAAVAVLF